MKLITNQTYFQCFFIVIMTGALQKMSNTLFDKKEKNDNRIMKQNIIHYLLKKALQFIFLSITFALTHRIVKVHFSQRVSHIQVAFWFRIKHNSQYLAIHLF